VRQADRQTSGSSNKRIVKEHSGMSDAVTGSTPKRELGRPPSIADRYADLLAPLTPRQRRGLVARLAHGYYDGWRPGRAEIAALVAQELGRNYYAARRPSP
jgi:hypothetical protein